MFNGIIQNIGKIIDIKSHLNNQYSISTQMELDDIKIGSSVSCNGICLTVTNIGNINNFNYFDTNISEETISRTNLKYLNENSFVNLEKSLIFGNEIAGHFVYGHIDCVTKLLRIKKMNSSWVFEFQNFDDKNLKKFIVSKGSISINGISLTIANVTNEMFSVSIIPHTYNNTNLKYAKEEDYVNIEFDNLARYIFKHE